MSKARAGFGFTLVEVLVATALLALVMLGLLTALRSFAQTEARIDERVRIDDGLRVSERFLRAIMASVSPRLRPTAAGAPKQIDFTGGGEAMRWIGVMPARHGAGGLYRFHLFARPADAGAPAVLMLEFAPYVPGFDAPLEPAAAQSRAMAVGMGEVRFRYQDEAESGEVWLAEWPHSDRLPKRIALSLVSSSRPWPEMVVGVLPVTGSSVAARGGGLAAGSVIGPF
jgi:general secretion pathway protein J